MAQTLAELVVKLTAETADFSAKVESELKHVQRFAREVEKAGREISVAFSLPLIGVGLEAFHAALEESRQTGGALAASWDTLTSAGHVLAQQVGQALLPLFQELVAIALQVIATLTQMVTWFQSLSPGVQKTVETVLLLVAALGPALVIFGKLVSAVAGVGKAFLLLVGPGAPIAVAVLAIAALAAWAYIFINDWTVVKEQFYLIWVAMKEAVFTSIELILQGLVKLTSAGSTLVAIGKGIGGVTGGILSGIGTRLAGIAPTVNAVAAGFQAWADGSLAQSAVRIQQLDHDIATAGATITTHTQTVGRFQAVMDQLAASLAQARVQAALQGSSFNLAAAEAAIYHQTLEQLIGQGAQLGDVLGNQGQTLRSLEAAYQSLTIAGVLQTLTLQLHANATATDVVGSSFRRSFLDASAYREAIDTLVALGVPLNTTLAGTTKTLGDLQRAFQASTAAGVGQQMAQGFAQVTAKAAEQGPVYDQIAARLAVVKTAVAALAKANIDLNATVDAQGTTYAQLLAVEIELEEKEKSRAAGIGALASIYTTAAAAAAEYEKILDSIAKGHDPTLDDLVQAARVAQEEVSIFQSSQKAIQQAVAATGTAIVGILAGTHGAFGSFLKGIVGIIGQLLENVGEALIAFGTAGIAIKAFISNPFLALAAGAALVGLGAALASTASANVSAAGSSLSSGSSYVAAASSAPSGSSASDARPIIIVQIVGQDNPGKVAKQIVVDTAHWQQRGGSVPGLSQPPAQVTVPGLLILKTS